MKRSLTIPFLCLLVLFILIPQLVIATSQWARKYDSACTLCHTAFPRLTYFGEKFMLNGYQIPGSQDGGEEGKEAINEDLVIGKLGDIFGLRINMTPLEIIPDGFTKDGEEETAVHLGNTPWLQLFTAGSIFKNVSIFIETELELHGIKNNWFRLGFHNLFGPPGAANLRVGKLSPMEWHVTSGRLRAIPPVKNQIISKVKSSNGKGENSVPMAAALPGVDFYGWQGPVLYGVGVINGKDAAVPDIPKDVFGTLKFTATSGDFEGSAFSVWGMYGVDTDSTETDQRKNKFWRLSPGVNLRYQGVDLLVSYFYSEEDNWTLAEDSLAVTNKLNGLTAVVGYYFTPKVFGAVQYDWIDSDLDAGDINYHKVTPSLWFFARENMRIGLTGRVDLQEKDLILHPKKEHEFFVTIRSMF